MIDPYECRACGTTHPDGVPAPACPKCERRMERTGILKKESRNKMDSRTQAIQRIDQVYDEITNLLTKVISLENEIQKMRNTTQPLICPECKQPLGAQDGYYFCVTPDCGNAPEEWKSDDAESEAE